MNTIDEQIEQKKKEIELLELKKNEEELKLEIRKINKTTVEETTIIRKIIHQDYPIYNFPLNKPYLYPQYPNTVWCSATNNLNNLLTK